MPKRDRSNENWSLKRKRSSVEKVAPRVPSYVDFGILSSRTSFSIRYDPISKLFDVRDALAFAFGSEQTAKKILAESFKTCEQLRVRWCASTTDDNAGSGKGRALEDASTIRSRILNAIKLRPRADLFADGTAYHFKRLSESDEPPDCLKMA